jgi:hypothetical protein
MQHDGVWGQTAGKFSFYSTVSKNSNGRWTDILMKENGKWLFIGDHGGKTSKE